MNNKLRSRKLSRRRNTSRRKGSLKKKSKMMKGGLSFLPKEQTGIDVIFYFMRGQRVEGEEMLTIRANFGGSLEKTLYSVNLGGPCTPNAIIINKEWKQLQGSMPMKGSATQKHRQKHGNTLHFHLLEHTYTRNDFNGAGTGGGITQIIHKIYNLKDRLCEYYGVQTQ